MHRIIRKNFVVTYDVRDVSVTGESVVEALDVEVCKFVDELTSSGAQIVSIISCRINEGARCNCGFRRWCYNCAADDTTKWMKRAFQDYKFIVNVPNDGPYR